VHKIYAFVRKVLSFSLSDPEKYKPCELTMRIISSHILGEFPLRPHNVDWDYSYSILQQSNIFGL
jgi:hypothetical protein